MRTHARRTQSGRNAETRLAGASGKLKFDVVAQGVTSIPLELSLDAGTPRPS